MALLVVSSLFMDPAGGNLNLAAQLQGPAFAMRSTTCQGRMCVVLPRHENMPRRHACEVSLPQARSVATQHGTSHFCTPSRREEAVRGGIAWVGAASGRIQRMALILVSSLARWLASFTCLEQDPFEYKLNLTAQLQGRASVMAMSSK